MASFKTYINTRNSKVSTIPITTEYQNDITQPKMFEISRINESSNNSEGQSFIQDFQPFLNHYPKLSQKKINLKLQNPYQQYQNALIMINMKDQKAQSKGTNILKKLWQKLRLQIIKDKKQYQLHENVVFNLWNIIKKNNNKEKKQRLDFLKNCISQLQKSKLNIKGYRSNKLHLLIFQQAILTNIFKNYQQALSLCEKSILQLKGIPSHTKQNYIYKLKILYLKSQIYRNLNQFDLEFQQIRKCQLIIKNIGVNEQKNLQELISIILQREKQLISDKKNKQTFSFHQKSNHKLKRTVSIRHRTFSLSKLVIEDKYQLTNKNVKNNWRSISKKTGSKGQQKLYTNVQQIMKRNFMHKNSKNKNINKKNISDLKLKKKPLQINHEYSNKRIQEDALKQIENIKKSHPNYQDLILCRPISQQLKQVQIEIKDNQIIKNEQSVGQLQQNYFQQTQISKEVQIFQYCVIKPKTNLYMNQVIEQFQNNILESYIIEVKDIFEQKEQKNIQNSIELSSQIDKSYYHYFNQLISQKFRQDFENKTFIQNKPIIFGIGIVQWIQVQLSTESISQDYIKKGYHQCVILQTKLKLFQSSIYCFKLTFPIKQCCNFTTKKILNLLDEQTKIPYHKNITQLNQSTFQELKQHIIFIVKYNIEFVRSHIGLKIVQCPLTRSQNSYYLNHYQQKMNLYETNIQTLSLKQQNNYKKKTIKSYNREVGSRIILKSQNVQNKINNDNLDLQISNNKNKMMQQIDQLIKQKLVQLIDLQNHKCKFKHKLKTHINPKKARCWTRTSKTSKQLPVPGKLHIVEEQILKANLIQPINFSDRIASFLMRTDDCEQQFYHCMKFTLIQWNNTNELLNKFFQCSTITHMSNLVGLGGIIVKMNFFCVKQMYHHSGQCFYEFELQQRQLRTKMMKFILSTNDILNIAPNYKDIDNTMDKMFIIMQIVCNKLIYHKDIMYYSVGLSINHEELYLQNKFRLQDNYHQNCNRFLSPNLKILNILSQQSIKIRYTCSKYYFGIVSIMKIKRSQHCHVYIYIAEIQKTFSFNLGYNILNYFTQEDIGYVFQQDAKLSREQLTEIMFQNCIGNSSHKMNFYQMSKPIWSRFLSLLRFQVQPTQDRSCIIVHLSNYSGFIKDCSLYKYFKQKNNVLHIQISLEKRSHPTIKPHNLIKKNIHRKQVNFNPSKNQINNGNSYSDNDIQFSNSKVHSSPIESNMFNKIANIFEYETKNYIIYCSITNIYQFQQQSIELQPQQLKQLQCNNANKINFSFYLSDLTTAIKNNIKIKSINSSKYLNSVNQFNQECYSYAEIVSALNTLKNKFIKQLSNVNNLYSCFNERKLQQQIKTRILTQMNRQAQIQKITLNSYKQNYDSTKSRIIMIDKSVVNAKKKKISCIFYDAINEKFILHITNNSSQQVNELKVNIQNHPLPFIRILDKKYFQFFHHRMSNYYRNVVQLI